MKLLAFIISLIFMGAPSFAADTAAFQLALVGGYDFKQVKNETNSPKFIGANYGISFEARVGAAKSSSYKYSLFMDYTHRDLENNQNNSSISETLVSDDVVFGARIRALNIVLGGGLLIGEQVFLQKDKDNNQEFELKYRNLGVRAEAGWHIDYGSAFLRPSLRYEISKSDVIKSSGDSINAENLSANLYLGFNF